MIHAAVFSQMANIYTSAQNVMNSSIPKSLSSTACQAFSILRNRMQAQPPGASLHLCDDWFHRLRPGGDYARE
jgi:hypothetical protein